MAICLLVRRGWCAVIVLLWFSLPAFPQERTTPVEVRNEPVVKLDPASNTVKAQQDGTWSVEIAPSANMVSEQPRYAVRRLWDNDFGTMSGFLYPCAPVFLEGYREVRALFLTTAPVSTPSNLRVWIRLYPFGYPGTSVEVGYVTFGQPAEPFVKSAANYSQQSSVCMLSFPVWAKACVFVIQNNTGDMVTISKESYVYLTN